ncbi:hypothetical protein BN1195_04277 [Chryseobacterium oranimense G311]|uniref:bacteriocin-like protein n=1 Tax=Chryseobacterium oranimense TaxID=421058 RepID=UPI000533A07C|nr:hypothetical protein [Chryseobacterium oranimense]CEJ71923.1 hypothetical protein BN1195_04277 [Chryseobacterium oranimense G311]
MLKNLQKLDRENLKRINGGGGKPPICDIGPVGCPCIIPPGDPCLGGGGGGTNPGDNLGYCPDNQSYIPCDQVCPSGMSPFCAL